ncbi:MAG TPA: FTR1 family protein, partial [Roseiflexaceae bacterium]|nr:FTR1 family protein [Roseiflexaceae bacterium]
MYRMSLRVALVLLTLLLLPVVSVGAQGSSVADQVLSLKSHAQEGVEAAERNQPDVMRAEYEELHTLWEAFEDGVRNQDAAGYVEIEGALAAIKDALASEPLDAAAVRAAYEHLGDEAEEVAERLGGATTGAAAAPVAAQSPAGLLEPLAAAREAVAAGDVATAKTEIDELIRAWPAVEGAIATQDPDAYTAIEVGLGRAAGAIKAEPADLTAAGAALEQLETTLTPFTRAQTYTALDAAAIILREGLEALLVVVALLAFLRRSGNSDKRRWIWIGGGLGVLASLVVAVLLQAIFSRVSAGQNRELIEGATGLVAAVLLFYVSYWLHSKASLHTWQAYINT